MIESFAILDANGFALAYVYFADDEQRASVMRRMSHDSLTPPPSARPGRG